MKRILLLLLGVQVSLVAGAQDKKMYSRDSSLSRWVIDVNVMGGMLLQDYTTNNTLANYPNAVNSTLGHMDFSNGYSIGGDAQVGFFFGRKRHWGIGTGFNYMYQVGNAGLRDFHVEYQATDYNGHVYRQVVSSNYKLSDRLTITNMNIPLVLKYKNRFSRHWGFTADAGAMFNLQMKNDYRTSGSFNYEAIYKFAEGGTTVYDNSPTPSSGDYFITKANFLRDNPNGNVQAYFDELRSQGNNVGLNVTPATQKGTVSYKTGSVGVIVRPSMNLFLSDNVALDFGLYYVYQNFKNDAASNYTVTGVVGDYNPTLHSVTSVNTHNFGVNVGARFFLGEMKDRDHDGVPDKKDLCPDDSGLAIYHGCPDRDGDGIIDKEDSCPDVKGLAKYHGCPDSDGDGIIDMYDECPYTAGLPQFHGCPDRDGDGIPDKDDACPDVAGLAQFHGCPDRDGDGIPDKDDRCPDQAGPASNYGCPEEKKDTAVEERIDVSTPILFEFNSTKVHQSSMPILQEAAKEVNDDRDSYIKVDGHADAIGSRKYNQGLSVRRAQSVKSKLTKMGVSPKKVKVVGHGEDEPAADNGSPAGRAQNRRAIMTIQSSKRK